MNNGAKRVVKEILTCALSLIIAVGATSSLSSQEAPSESVDRKFAEKKLTENDDIDHNDASPTEGVVKSVGRKFFIVTSPKYNPPGDDNFLKFESGNRVDIDHDPATLTRIKSNEPKLVQFEAVFFLRSAGVFPLRGEGNLPTEGEEEGKLPYWSSKVSACKGMGRDLDNTNFRIMISRIHDKLHAETADDQTTFDASKFFQELFSRYLRCDNDGENDIDEDINQLSFVFFQVYGPGSAAPLSAIFQDEQPDFAIWDRASRDWTRHMLVATAVPDVITREAATAWEKSGDNVSKEDIKASEYGSAFNSQFDNPERGKKLAENLADGSTKIGDIMPNPAELEPPSKMDSLVDQEIGE